METQQALLRQTIDLNSELIAQADRLIFASRSRRDESPENNCND